MHAENPMATETDASRGATGPGARIARIARLAACLLALPAAAQAQYTYSIANNTVTIKRYIWAESVVAVPATIEGKPVVAIAQWAFSGSPNLTEVSIPAGVSSIGTGAFAWCDRLTQITVDGLNPAYLSENGVLFNKSKTQLIQYPGGKAGGYAIPSGVAAIGARAFYSCDGLTGVHIPSSVTSIGDGAFLGCTGLSVVAVPNSVGSIGNMAFAACRNLSGITVGSHVAALGSYAFGWCANLTGAYFLGTPPNRGTYVFGYSNNSIVYYVSGTSGWGSSYAGRPTAPFSPSTIVATPETRAVGFEAGATTFAVANAGAGTLTYTAIALDPWMTLTGGASGTGSGTIAISYLDNLGTTTRTGTVSITALGAAAPKSVTIVQEGRRLSISPASRFYSCAEAAGQTISVSANVAWTATASVPWITVTSGNAGTGNGATSFNVASNSDVIRTGTIEFSGGGINRTFTVNQWPAVSMPGVSADGDFDGDGAADIAVFHPTTGNWHLLFSTGAHWTLEWGWPQAVPVPADYNGDGMLDFAVYYPVTGNWYILESATGLSRVVQWGWSDAVPLPGDYDGDGKADIAVYHRATATWYFLCTSAGSYPVQWGFGGVIPAPADYDGDGIIDIGVYHPTSGMWYILQSGTGTMLQKAWGWIDAIPVPADYDGDGKADIAVFHRAAGNWYLSLSSGGSRTAQWGWPSVVPVPADYDDDGVADIAVYYPAAGDWYILQSTTETMVQSHLGASDMQSVLLYPVIHSWYQMP